MLCKKCGYNEVHIYKDIDTKLCASCMLEIITTFIVSEVDEAVERSGQADGACTCEQPYFLEYEDGEHCKVCGKTPRR